MALTTPINGWPSSCKKDQLICFNKCKKFGPTTREVFIFGSFSNEKLYSGSLCITNDGPGLICIAVISGCCTPSTFELPPNSGILLLFHNANGIVAAPHSDGPFVRGHLKVEIQEIVKLDC